MIILSIRTDKPEAELGLFDDEHQLVYKVWQAHRELAETLHVKIDEILRSENKAYQDIAGIVCYKGPGSFTGLRIGLSVANALAYSFSVPIVGIEGADKWLETGLKALLSGQNDRTVMPEYGAPVHVTVPKH